MKRSNLQRMRKGMLVLLMFMMLCVFGHPPIHVEARLVEYEESFADTDYLDVNATTVGGWGHDVIRIPFKDASKVANCSVYASSYAWRYGDFLYACVIGSGIKIVNITDSTNPVHVGTIPISNPTHVNVQGHIAYVSATDGLHVMDITDITNPTEVDLYNPGSISHFTIDGNYGFLATGSEGIQVLDISIANAPSSVFNYTHPNASVYYQTYKAGNYLLALDYGTPYTDYALQIINATDPTDITSISRFITDTYSLQMHVSGDYVFICGSTLKVISIVNVTDPELVNDIPNIWWGSASKTVLSGHFIYGVSAGSLQILRIANVSQMRLDYVKIPYDAIWIAMKSKFAFTGSSEGIVVYELNDALLAVAQSLPVYEATSDSMITQTMLEADVTTPSSTTISYYLSADNGTTWEHATPNVNHEFTAIGRALLWSAVLETSVPGTTPEIDRIKLTFKIQLLPPEIPTITYAYGYNRPRFEWDNIPEDTRIFLEVDTVDTFDSLNLLTDDRTHFQPVIMFDEPLENGTWYYRFALMDMFGDMGLYSVAYSLQIGTTSSQPPPLTIDPLMLFALVGAIAVVVVLAVVYRRKGK